MNRILLLFVLLISFAAAHARPEMPDKINKRADPIEIYLSAPNATNCDSLLVQISFVLALPADEMVSAAANLGDGQEDILLDSTQLRSPLTFATRYTSAGTKRITFRLLKTNGQYEEKTMDYYVTPYRNNLIFGAHIIYNDYPTTRLEANTRQWSSMVWSTGETGNVITANGPGTYWVTAVDPCGRTVSDTVVIRPPNQSGIEVKVMGAKVNCDSVEYQLFAVDRSGIFNPYRWDFQDGTIRVVPNPTYSPKGGPNFHLIMYGKDGKNNEVYYSNMVFVSPPGPASYGTDKQALKLDTLALTGTFGFSGFGVKPDLIEKIKYKWSTGDTTATLKVTQPGLYTLESGLERCFEKYKATYPYQVNRAVLKPIVAPTDQTGLSYTFTDSATTSYYDKLTWSFGDNTTASGREVTHTYTKAGIYKVQLFGESNNYSYSKDTVVTYVTAGERLEVDLGNDRLICPGQTIRLQPAGQHNGYQYLWANGDTSYDINITEPGQYRLQVIAGNRIGFDTINFTAGCILKAWYSYKRANDGQLTMDFTEASTGITNGITKRSWDFGDGTVATTANPSHTYTQPGYYNVRMWISDSIAHQQDSITRPVYIMPPVQVALGKDTTIAAGQSLMLDAGEAIGSWSTDAAYLWSTGDSNRVITVNEAGIYSLKVTMYGYVSTDTIKILVDPPPVNPDISMEYRIINWIPGKITLQNTSTIPGIVKTTWYMGDGNTIVQNGDGSNEVAYTYASAGTYEVTMETLTSDNRIYTSKETIKVWPPFNAGNDTVYRGTPIIFKLNEPLYSDSTVTCTWYPGPVTGQQITVTGPGTYYAYVKAKGYSAADTFRVLPTLITDSFTTKQQNGRFVFELSAFEPAVYRGIVNWSFSDGSIDVGPVVTHTFPQPGNYQVKMWRSATAGDTVIKQLIVKPLLQIDLGADTTFYGSPVSLQINAPYYGDSTVTCVWNPGGITGQQFTVTAPGMYYVTATQYGYVATDSILVREGRPRPVSDFSAIRANDGKLTMNYSAMPATGILNATYSWMFGDQATGSGQQASHTYAQAGNYRVTMLVTDSIHTDTVVRQVDVIPFVSVDLGPDTIIARGQSIVLDAIKAVGIWHHDITFLWSTGDTSRLITVTQPGTYTLTVNMYGRTVSDSISITIAAELQADFHNRAVSADRLTQHFYNDSRQGRYSIARSVWEFGDGQTVETLQKDSVAHRYTGYGVYTVKLTVFDSAGFTNSTLKTILLSADSIPQHPPVIDSNQAVVDVKDSLPVHYTFPHELNPDNTITIQLIKGGVIPGAREAEPDIIDISKFPSTNPNVTTNIKLPDSIPCGKNYRIRLVSSSPADTTLWSSGFEILNPPAIPTVAQRGDSLESSAAYAYQWYRNGQPVNGATSRAIRAKINGSYQVEVFSTGACSTLSAPVSMVITGLEEVELTVTKLNVSPNPSHGAVYLKLEKAPATPLLIQVYNSRGNLVHTAMMSDKQMVLDLSTQPKGVYYILKKGGNKEKATPIVIQ